MQQDSAPAPARGGGGGGGGRGAGDATVPVTVATATKRDLPIYLTGLGTAQASFTVAIRSQVDGKLQEVLFTEGRQVHKGDVLAKIDPRLYQAALDQAKARKAQDEALLVSAKKDLIRFKTLVDKSVQTMQSLEQQQAKVDQLVASIEADDASIETAKTQLDYTTITAPNDGRMGVRNTDPGNFLRAADSTAIATLTLTKPAAVLFTLSARALNDVRDAMARGPVEVTALSQDNVRVLGTGKLLLIDSIVDQASATMRLKAMFDNEDERLWPGDFVNARVRSLTAWYEMVHQKNISASARITSDSCDTLNSFDLPSSVISRQNLPAAVNVSAYAKKARLDGASASTATSDQLFPTIAGNFCGVKLLHSAVSLLTVVLSSRWSALARGNSADGDHCCSKSPIAVSSASRSRVISASVRGGS